MATGTKELTPLAEVILRVIKNAGGKWLTRQEIAERMGRPGRITPYDIDLLNTLAEQGYIEARKAVAGVAREQWEYRAIEG